jgi:DNA-directed RNA polymerase subunit beta
MAKPHPFKLGPKVERMSFSRIDETFEMPNLIDVQKQSYEWFMEKGLREVLADVSPIKSPNSSLEIEFLDFRMNEPPKYLEEECKDRDANYASPLRVTVRLYNRETGEVTDKEMFMGDFPLMTDNGTFIINGA